MRDFKKYSAKQIKERLAKNTPEILDLLVYPKNKAKHKIWEERFDDLHLYSRKVCETKIHYIHLNPVEAGLVAQPEEYNYSSARFYWSSKPVKSNLKHYLEVIG